jgi:hypothetical protein
LKEVTAHNRRKEHEDGIEVTCVLGKVDKPTDLKDCSVRVNAGSQIGTRGLKTGEESPKERTIKNLGGPIQPTPKTGVEQVKNSLGPRLRKSGG